MKIFIYAQGRSGSNAIVKALTKNFNYSVPWVAEFNSRDINFDIFDRQIEKDNIILKLHPGQKTTNFHTDIQFLQYIKTNFDIIIFHARANVFDTALSLHNGLVLEDYEWTDNKYTPIIDRPEIDHIRYSAQVVADLVLYAKTFDKELTFYEELFTGDKELTINTIKRWGIDSNLLSYDILLEMFNPKHKYTNKL